MLPLRLGLPTDRVHVVALGAHPDDIEIGCGATLLQLARTVPELTATFVVATGDEVRLDEARHAAQAFVPGREVVVASAQLPDGRLPAHWDAVKDLVESCAGSRRADLVFAPRTDDKHQDHRLLGELATTAWRDQLILNYEIPKWDGDLSRTWLYVPMTEAQLHEKLELLTKSFPSQTHHDWFDDDVFAGLARLRGMECRATYAEAFGTAKARLAW